MSDGGLLYKGRHRDPFSPIRFLIGVAVLVSILICTLLQLELKIV